MVRVFVRTISCTQPVSDAHFEALLMGKKATKRKCTKMFASGRAPPAGPPNQPDGGRGGATGLPQASFCAFARQLHCCAGRLTLLTIYAAINIFRIGY